MFDVANLKKTPRLASHAPAAMDGFKALDKAALAETVFVAAALRAGAAATHGTHLFAQDVA